MELRQAVDGAGKQVRSRMLEAVPAGVVRWVTQPEVRALVDDGGAGREQVAGLRRGQTVGQRHEHRVRLGQRGIDVVAGPGKVGMHRADRLLLPAATLEPDDPHVGVSVEQSHHLAAGIAGGSDDAHPDARPPADGRQVSRG